MGKGKNLTEGSITAHLVYLAVPLILGNILQQLYNTIDAVVIARFSGAAEFAAIGVSASVMNLFVFAIVGACVGISVLFAQQYGAGDFNAFRNEHFISFSAGLLCTLLIAAAGILFMNQLLRLIQTPGDIFIFVKHYLTIVLIGLPATFFYNLYSALLRAVGKTGAALLALAVAVVVNLLLDLLFIAVMGWGIRGAAWATVFAQILAAGIALLYLRKKHPNLLFHRSDCYWNPHLLRKTAHYSVVTGLHQSGLYLGKLLVQGAVNSAGTAVIAAFTATTRIEGFANSFGDSGAAATSVVVAQNLGAGKYERVEKTFRASLFLLFVLGIFCSVIMFFTASQTVQFMLAANSGPAFENGVVYIQLIALFYTFCFTGNTFAGYFDGRGYVTISFIGAIGHVTLRVILAWLFIAQYELSAVAVATGIGWVLVNIFWTIIHLRRRFRKPADVSNTIAA